MHEKQTLPWLKADTWMIRIGEKLKEIKNVTFSVELSWIDSSLEI